MRRAVPEGHKVRFTHRRRAQRPRDIVRPDVREELFTAQELKDRGLKADPKGGETVCQVFDDQDVEVAQATAYCNPLDGYNRKIGRDISLGRALVDLEDRTLAAEVEGARRR